MRLLTITLLICASLFAQSNLSIQSILSKLAAAPALRHAHWSVYARNIDSGEVLVDLDSGKRMAPASGLKLFTSAAALELLGADYRYQTRLYVDGPIDTDGIVTGNLIIRGSGDPTLGSDRLDKTLALDSLMSTWLNAIKKAGIRQIQGKILADATLFDDTPVPGNWLWIDLGNYYGSGVSALSLNENLYHLFFKPARVVSAPATVLRTIPQVDLTFINKMQTGAPGSGDNGYVYRAPNSSTATLRGTIPAGVDSFSIKGSMPDPAQFCVRYLKQYLEKAGIRSGIATKFLRAPAYNNLRLLYSTTSPPLSAIIYHLNKRSVNHIAEQLLFTIAADSVQPATRAIGLQRIKSFLNSKGVNTEALHLVDGSGLSPNNFITTRMMVDLLTAMRQSKNFEVFNASLALAGDAEDIGYFKRFGKNTVIEKKCRLKSGLIEGVRSHSGYLQTSDGQLIAFSFIANGITVSYRKIDKLHEKLLVLLAEQSSNQK